MAILVTAAAVRLAAAEGDYPIRPVSFTDVQVSGDFWSRRIETNREVTVPYDFKKCEETGRIENFAVAGGLRPGGFQGIYFNDSDVFKVIEGASYCLAVEDDPRLDKYLDELIEKIAAAQEEDGYLYTARTIGDPDYDYPGRQERWSHLAHGHELYNVGHLYEAAVAHFRATGKRSLLEVALQNADLVCRVFGPGEGQRVDVPGHEEIEIGLVKLYRVTGEEKYLDQARFFIDMRGRSDLRRTYGAYCQDHLPVAEQTEPVGHAVRAGYLYAGATDIAALTGNQAYARAMGRIWEDIVSRKLYITGGIGSSRHGEAFGEPFELPNASAYNETCAAIALALFSHRMFLLHGDGKYVDLLERIIYNGFLAGVSLEGDRFFYPNPLACDGRSKFNQGVLGRSPWFGCSCCPVNVVRFVPSIAGYVYAVRDADVYVNLYVGGQGEVTLAGDEASDVNNVNNVNNVNDVNDVVVTLDQETEYPWKGTIDLRVEPQTPAEFALRLRIPEWARGRPVASDLYRYADPETDALRLEVNGEPFEASLDSGYAVVRRTWKRGDLVRLELPMVVRRVLADPRVEANSGRVAIERGPIVYCIEGVDHDGSIASIYLPDDAALRAEHRSELLGGLTVVLGEARRLTRQRDGQVESQATELMAIPYYAWAHREVGEMAVWLPRTRDHARARPGPTLASRSRATASHVWQADTVDALNDQVEPESSDDHSIPRHTWWDHRGTTEWLQYDFPGKTTVSEVAVYWFDDTGIGQCRLPDSWRLVYRDGQSWKPVRTEGEFEVARDRFNRVRFEPVETTALRLEARLRPGFSGGVLEWRVE